MSHTGAGMHRAFSRDARGMPAYVKKKKEIAPTTQPSAGAEANASAPDDLLVDDQ